MKKLNMILLTLLIIGQTVLGPIGVVSAGELTDDSSDEKTEDIAIIASGSEDNESDDGNDSESDNGAGNEPDHGNSSESDNGAGNEPDHGNSSESDNGAGNESDNGNGSESDNGAGNESDDGNGSEFDNRAGNESGNGSGSDSGDGDEELESFTQTTNFDPVMPDKVIRGVTFTVNNKEITEGQTVEVKNGDKANFKFNVKLEPGHEGGNYGEGTTLTYELPAIFEGLELPGGEQFGELGTIAVSGRAVTITFNDKINDHAPIENAWFEVSASFLLGNSEWENIINLPAAGKIKLNFQPKGGTTVKKTGTPENSGKNSKFIDWKVIVNTNLGATGAQDFIDELEGEHEFVDGSVVVKEIPITPSGPGTVGTSVAVNTLFENDKKKMTITLPDKGYTGYEITYQTKLGDPGNVEKATFKNNATYNGTSTSANQTITFGKPLDKKRSGPGTNLVTEWTINYNFNNQHILQSDAKLSDTWTVEGGSGTPKQDLVSDSFKVYKEDGTTEVAVNIYEVSYRDDGFNLSFKQDVTKPYVIKYKTKPNGVYPTSNFTVSNVVKRDDMDETKSSKSYYNKQQLLLNKTAEGVDYQNKTMSWKIVANHAKYELDAGAIFEDIFTGNNIKLIENTLVVKDGNDELTKDTGYSLVNNGNGGFAITLTAATSNQIEITYDTEYGIKDVGENDRTYKNEVVLKSNLSETRDSATQTIKGEQKANGKKSGYYDYETKTFHWDVLLNFNYNTLNNALFEDQLPETQEVKSFTVVEGTLDAGGNFVPGDTKIIQNTSGADHKIKLKLGEITGPYKVTYTSKDADGVFPHGKGNEKITNTAKLSSGAGENASWTKTVEVKHTDKILNKSGQQVGASALINWNFEFNYAQSKLDNVVITDTVGKDGEEPVQLILPDSFEVYKVNLTGQTPNGPSEEKVAPGEYTLKVDVEKGEYSLELGDVNEAYYVTYKTVFTGEIDVPVKNNVDVKYNSSEGSSGKDGYTIKNFKYGSFATTTKVPFVVLKTDGATGELMKDVEFTLYGPYTGDTPLFKGKTDGNGVLDFGVKFAEGTYTLKETKVSGYENPDVKFDLDRSKKTTVGIYAGKQLVEVENFEENYGPACTVFTLTVKDVNGNLVKNKEITLTNKATGQEHEVETDEDGQLKIPSSGVHRIAVGEYTITTKEGRSGVLFGEVGVHYDGDCKAMVQPAPSCNVFTITVKDVDKSARANVKVTVKDSGGKEVTTLTTDKEGKINVPSTDLPAGDYTLYEGDLFIGVIKVSYLDNCEAELKGAPVCIDFTLTVKDRGNNPREEGVEVTVRDADGKNVIDADGKEVFTTDKNGQVKIDGSIKQGTYRVYEGNRYVNQFTVQDECEAEVRQRSSGGGTSPQTCDVFTLTMKAEGKVLDANAEFTLKTETKEVSGKTDVNGKITFDKADLPEGKYSVYDMDNDKVGTISVKYTQDDCKAEIDMSPKVCDIFTVTVKEEGKKLGAGVELTLKSGLTEVVGKTDANGEIIFGKADLAEGTYTVYDNNGRDVGSVTVIYAYNDCQAEVDLSPKVCDVFTVTVKEEGKKIGANVELTLKSGATEVVGKTDTNGKVIFDKADLPAGTYTAYDKNGTDVGTVTVKYTLNDCYAELDMSPKVCEVFTVTVKEEGKKIGANVELTLKSGSTEVVGKTDANGKIVFDKANLPEGTYTAYDQDGNEVTTVTVTYWEGKCAAEIDLNPKACETFTLTVKDKPNVDVVLKDKNGNTVATGKTDANGKVVFDEPIMEGKYDVYVQGENIGQITATDSCMATLIPGTPEEPDPETPGTPGGPNPENPEKPKPSEPGDKDSNKPGDGGKDPQKPGADGNAGSGTKVDSSGKLPQTGEEQLLYMIALGFLLLAAGGVILFRPRREA